MQSWLCLRHWAMTKSTPSNRRGHEAAAAGIRSTRDPLFSCAPAKNGGYAPQAIPFSPSCSLNRAGVVFFPSVEAAFVLTVCS